MEYGNVEGIRAKMMESRINSYYAPAYAMVTQYMEMYSTPLMDIKDKS